MAQSLNDRRDGIWGNLAFALFAAIAATVCLLASTGDRIITENEFLLVGLTYIIALSYIVSAIYDYYKYRALKKLTIATP